MFTVYSERDIFEDIMVFNDVYPNWFEIIRTHSEICLNMSDADLAAELVPDTAIFQYCLATGGKSPVALADYFTQIYQEKVCIAEKPRSAFFLKCTPAEAAVWEADCGVIVQSGQKIDDGILRGTFYRELPKGAIVENGKTIGWHHLFSNRPYPCNSLVVSDDFLFTNTEQEINVGYRNLERLLDAILPDHLSVPFHIAIIASDYGKSKEWGEQLVGRLKASVIQLRKYDFVFEVIFMKALHKRRFMSNYANGSADHGFAMFKVADNKTVREDNDFRMDTAFTRINPSDGDTDFKSAEIALKSIKSKYLAVKAYINATGAIEDHRILGDCQADKTINNRLINDV